MCHTIHTNHTIKLSYITYKYDMILSYIPYKYEIGQTAAEGMPRFQRTASGPRTGRGPRQETRIRLLTAMVAAKEADAKGRGSRWGVISRRHRLLEEVP